jgi:Nucleotidyl transferase AbiEii toxin, Type IV TA system
VSAAYEPPAGPPPSAGVLAKYVLAYARAGNLAEGRVRAWISYMITAGMLERATTGELSFVIKGGVALELRLRDRARATKDLDVAPHHPTADLALTLERALTSEAYQGFSPPLDLPEHWIDPINRLIRELELPIADAHAGLVRVRQFVDQILSSTETTNGNLR